MKVFNYLLVTTLFLALLVSCTAQTNTKLSAVEFEKEISSKKDIQILDVRTPGEFFSGHIKDALQADWNDKKEFERRLAFVDKKKPVYVYCLAGGRSAAAAEQMRSLGYTSVIELQGGTNAWRAANLPLIGASTEKQMSIGDFNATIAGSKTVLVDFGATWCPPCRQMEPVIRSVMEKNKEKVTLLNVDGGRDLAILKAYNVTALPVFIIFKDGKEVWRYDGITSEEILNNQLR